MQNLIAYYRVSTQGQKRSGLGLEAQRAALTQFAANENLTVVAEYIETETRKGADAMERRPQLRAAIEHAKRINGAVTVAKLDRLSGDVHFISGMMVHKIPFVVAELGLGVENFVLHLFAAVAERECLMISRRTKDALSAAKARGVKLGNPAQAQRNALAARQRAESLRAAFVPLTSLPASTAALKLNEAKIETPTGKPWSAQTVIRVRERLANALP